MICGRLKEHTKRFNQDERSFTLVWRSRAVKSKNALEFCILFCNEYLLNSNLQLIFIIKIRFYLFWSNRSDIQRERGHKLAIRRLKIFTKLKNCWQSFHYYLQSKQYLPDGVQVKMEWKININYLSTQAVKCLLLSMAYRISRNLRDLFHMIRVYCIIELSGQRQINLKQKMGSVMFVGF